MSGALFFEKCARGNFSAPFAQWRSPNAENMKTVGPSVRDRQIFDRTDNFLNLSVRLTDKKIADYFRWFYAGPIKNWPDRKNIGHVGPADRQKIDSFYILCKCLNISLGLILFTYQWNIWAWTEAWVSGNCSQDLHTEPKNKIIKSIHVYMHVIWTTII